MTIVTLEPISTAVLNVPIGMFSRLAPSGHSVAPTRNRM